MTARTPGPDHGHYRHAPLPGRAAPPWPGGARIALVVFLYLEHWELLPPDGAVRDPRLNDSAGAFVPDYRNHSWREYGNRVGMFRILDLLDRHGLRVTVPANAMACLRYPPLVEELLRRGYEVAAHGISATQMLHGRMGPGQEEDAIGLAIDTVARCTGRRPAGWVGQDYGESAHTPALLAKAGLDWVCDWPNDDQPYAMTTSPPLLSLPNQAEWDDVQMLWHRRVSLARYAPTIEAAFRCLHAEGAAAPRFFGLHLHPWVLGAPHRTHALADALGRLAAFDRVWNATGNEVSAWWRNAEGVRP